MGSSKLAIVFAVGAVATGFTGPASAEEPKSVTVTVRADDARAVVERRSGTESYAGVTLPDAALLSSVATWEPVCVAPCAARLDSRYVYRFARGRPRALRLFRAPARQERLALDAKEWAPAIGRLAGTALTAAGIGAALLGGAALVATPILENNDVGSPTLRTGVLVAGTALLSVGAVALVSGLWVWMHNGTTVRTSVSF